MKIKRSLIYVVLLIVVVLAGAAIYEFTKPVTYYGSHIEPPKPMPDFTLQSAKGPVALSSFRGKYVVIYFGYTSCPDICPATSAALKAALEQLGGQSAQVQVLFVSVDYKRDTPEKLSNYVQIFRPDFIGLTGTQAQIDRVTADFGIFYQLNTPDAETGAYSVDHTATIMVLDREGRLVLLWANDQQPDEIVADLRILLRR
jgi:protein SCO1/2